MSNSFAEYSKKLTGIKPAREVFVAFLDILGFSGFVRNNTHDDLTKIYQAIFRSSIDYSLAEVAEQAVENSGCDVPLKEKGKPGGVVHELMPVVNWVQGIHDEDKSKFNADKIKESFFAHGKQVDSNAEEMILNTTKFFNKMSSHPVYKNEMSDEEYWNAVLEEMKAAEL